MDAAVLPSRSDRTVRGMVLELKKHLGNQIVDANNRNTRAYQEELTSSHPDTGVSPADMWSSTRDPGPYMGGGQRPDMLEDHD